MILPMQDDFETTLSQSWNWSATTLNVNTIPTATLPASQYTYVVVDPGKSNMQVRKVTAWTGTTITVTTDTIEKWAGLNYSVASHSAWAVVRFSNNFQFWKDIQTAINSKADGTDLWDFMFAADDITATGSTISIAQTWSNWKIWKDSNDMKFRDDNTPATTLTQLASWVGADQKVAVSATDTTTWVLNVKLTAGDGLKKTIINPAGDESLDLDIDLTDTTTFITLTAWVGDAWKVPVTDATWKLDPSFYDIWDIAKFWGTGADGALNIAAGTTTLTLANDTLEKNYSSINISWTALLEITGVSWAGGAIATIKCKWDFTMSWGAIRMDWQWASANNDGTTTVITTRFDGWAAWATVTAWGWGTAKTFVWSTAWKVIRASCWGGGWNGWAATGWSIASPGARWGGILIIEVGWAINFTAGTISASWADALDLGANNRDQRWWNGWGGWGWGWTVVVLYNTLTSTAGAVECNWWDWGNGESYGWATLSAHKNGWGWGWAGAGYTGGWAGWAGWTAPWVWVDGANWTAWTDWSYWAPGDAWAWWTWIQSTYDAWAGWWWGGGGEGFYYVQKNTDFF